MTPMETLKNYKKKNDIMRNIAEILKNAPKGTELYSPICGECELVCVERIDSENKICVRSTTTNSGYWFNHNGTVDRVNEGECLLFPSKYNRDWSTFKAIPEFKKGDFVYVKTKNNCEFIFIFNETRKRLILPLVAINAKNTYHLSYPDVLCYVNNISIQRIATEEEKQKLLKVIDESGYVWDEEKLELRKKEHEFKPFDKVIGRMTSALDGEWCIGLYSHYNEKYKAFITTSGMYNQCVPYNEETAHLLGTTEEYNGKYKTWED